MYIYINNNIKNMTTKEDKPKKIPVLIVVPTPKKQWYQKLFAPSIIVIAVALGLLAIALILGFAGVAIPGAPIFLGWGKSWGKYGLAIGILLLVIVNILSMVAVGMITGVTTEYVLSG